jgi:SAM-dependent MidA family methyltransferase
VLVERSTAQRELHRSGLPLEAAIGAFPTAHGEEEPPDARGPIAVSLGELPREPVVGMVIANELLDNLPFALCQRSSGRWLEVLVGVEGDRFVEVLIDAPQGHRELAESLAPDAPDGARIPVQIGVWSWLADALAVVESGRVVCIDYARYSDEMAADGTWLRTYRGHERGGHPLEAPGTQDITSDVAIDQLIRVKRPARVVSQVDWLHEHGIDELVAEGRAAWEAGAARGDLAALRGRSRVREAEALLDPSGLGAFQVMEWHV